MRDVTRNNQWTGYMKPSTKNSQGACHQSNESKPSHLQQHWNDELKIHYMPSNIWIQSTVENQIEFNKEKINLRCLLIWWFMAQLFKYWVCGRELWVRFPAGANIYMNYSSLFRTWAYVCNAKYYYI